MGICFKFCGLLRKLDFHYKWQKYHLFSVILKELAFRDSSANVFAALAFNCRNVASCFLIKYVPPPSMFELNWLRPSIFFVKFADYITWWQNMRANIGGRPEGSSNQTYPSCFYFRTSGILMDLPYFFSKLLFKPYGLGSRLDAESQNWSLISFLGESLVSRTGAVG